MANRRQSTQYSGLGYYVKVLTVFYVVPSSLGCGWLYAFHQQFHLSKRRLSTWNYFFSKKDRFPVQILDGPLAPALKSGVNSRVSSSLTCIKVSHKWIRLSRPIQPRDADIPKPEHSAISWVAISERFDRRRKFNKISSPVSNQFHRH